jgi:hypothetical protein
MCSHDIYHKFVHAGSLSSVGQTLDGREFSSQGAQTFHHDQYLIFDKKLKTNEMADIADCSERSINAIRSNLHYYGNTKAPPNGGGRPRSITPLMLEALWSFTWEAWYVPGRDGSVLMGQIWGPCIDI